MSAEFGYGSSTVNVSIKSGTNKLHGAGWEFLRNDAMDARLFFATRKPPLRRNQFGANAGGPVWIPKLYNGRDKTFWFFNYEGLRLRQGQSFAPSFRRPACGLEIYRSCRTRSTILQPQYRTRAAQMGLSGSRFQGT